MNNILQVSHELMEAIKALPADERPGYHQGIFDVVLCPYLPYESHLDACDVATRQEVKIMSGEWIHAILVPIPKTDPEGFNLMGNILKSKAYNL